MAFTWTTINDGTVITSAQWDEIKTNVDTLSSNLGISNYSWSEMPVSAGTKPDIPDIQELRDALDYVHNNNSCSAYDATNDASVYSGRDTSVNNSVNSSVDSSLNSSVHSPADATNYSSKDSTVYSGRDVTNYSGRDVTYYSAKNTTDYVDRHYTYNGAKYTIYSDIRLKKDIVYI